jgi:hypothetical protein
MRLTQPAAWAREAELGVVEGEEVSSPLSVLLRALGGLHLRDDDGRWVGAVGRLEDQPALIGAQLDQGGTRQEKGAPGHIILRT